MRSTPLWTLLKRYVYRKTYWFTFALLILTGVIIYQQFLIADLSNQIYQMYDSSNMLGFHSRLDNLEGRSNRDSARLDTIEDELYQHNRLFTNLDWRVKQLEWVHPDVSVNNAPPKAPTRPTGLFERPETFNANPKQVPDVDRQSLPMSTEDASPFQMKQY